MHIMGEIKMFFTLCALGCFVFLKEMSCLIALQWVVYCLHSAVWVILTHVYSNSMPRLNALA